MSMGGAYISIDEDKLNSILGSGESLSDFVFDEKNEDSGEVQICSLEQAWDAFNSLFSSAIPDLLGTDVLENVDLGEECHLISLSDVQATSHRLELISDDDFLAMLKSHDYQEADFYWDNVWKSEENTQEMLGMFQELKAFMKRAIEEQKVALLYIG